ncbi:hypothetical protein ACFYW1_04095 [Streptomyces sp. NPDC002669]|uniref:hypothetical protein n=1 Tax=Streptomyces sp. NPDC002669 TaxID=3364658 RepID=UPI0036BBD68D
MLLCPVVQGGDVGVDDLGSGHRLALEPSGQVRLGNPVEIQQLERDLTVEHAIPPAPHLAHATRPRRPISS